MSLCRLSRFVVCYVRLLRLNCTSCLLFLFEEKNVWKTVLLDRTDAVTISIVYYPTTYFLIILRNLLSLDSVN